jgi:CBS domain-containing protein
MRVGEHIRRNPVGVEIGLSVRDAAKQMEAQKAGCVVVVGDEGQPLGVLTDRDIVIRVLRRGLDPDETTVGSVMGDEVTKVYESTALTSAMRRMRAEGVRRIPVVDSAGGLVGLFDWSDALGIISGQLLQAARVARAQG